MKNSIYEGTVTHARFFPKIHKFQYNVSYYYFDLENPQDLIFIPPFLTFNQKNYLSPSDIRNLFTNSLSIKKIFILTQLSYLGYCFNPVSFYYCFDEKKELNFVIAHVTNTPWNEKHIYTFDVKKTKKDSEFKKEFHVSPFMPMEINYNWQFSAPAANLNVHMHSRIDKNEKLFFYAGLNLKAKEINHKNVILNILQFPVMSFKTVFAIYWQALIIYSKKIPFYTHPKKSEVR